MLIIPCSYISTIITRVTNQATIKNQLINQSNQADLTSAKVCFWLEVYSESVIYSYNMRTAQCIISDLCKDFSGISYVKPCNKDNHFLFLRNTFQGKGIQMSFFMDTNWPLFKILVKEHYRVLCFRNSCSAHQKLFRCPFIAELYPFICLHPSSPFAFISLILYTFFFFFFFLLHNGHKTSVSVK